VLEPLSDDEELSNNDDTIESSLNVEGVEKIFSDTWFFEDIEGKEEISMHRKVPNALAVWYISGFSMHPTKGLSLSSSTSKIVVKPDLSLQVNAPKSIYRGEIVKIDYTITNHLEKSLNVNVAITVKNGVILQEKIKNKCHSFTEKGGKEKDRQFTSIEIQADTSSDLKSFYVKASGIHPIDITVQVTMSELQAVKQSKVINVVSNAPQLNAKSEDTLESAIEYLDKTL
jgi:hypothetical protein